MEVTELFNQRRLAMKIDVRTIRDVYILDCSSKITLGEGTMSIRNTVKDLLQVAQKKIF
jgi:anti-sigma B factor antagonist